MSTLKFNTWLNTDNTENYKCRAWVNFKGDGTVVIRASGNVSSITDVGVGRYDVNFATAMPDTNYSAISSDNYYGITNSNEVSTSSASKVRIYCYDVSGAFIDASAINVAVFR